MQIIAVDSADSDLMRVAARVYGDATQWFLIASINGLSDPKITGQMTLLIPDPQAVSSKGVPSGYVPLTRVAVLQGVVLKPIEGGLIQSSDAGLYDPRTLADGRHYFPVDEGQYTPRALTAPVYAAWLDAGYYGLVTTKPNASNGDDAGLYYPTPATQITNQGLDEGLYYPAPGMAPLYVASLDSGTF